MSKQIKKLSLVFSSLMLGILGAVGCDVSENDVTAARENVSEEQRETAEVRREGQSEINEQKRELEEARHTAMRPSYGDDKHEEVADQQEELADAKREANENVREEERETQDAKADADKMERELAAKKERDAYVETIEAKIETVDERINSMQARLDDMDDDNTAYQELETDIEALQMQRENLSDALGELENAEVLEWETMKEKVEQACKRIENGNYDK